MVIVSNSMGKKTTTEEFIRKAQLVHGDRYDYSSSTYGASAHEKITIKCKQHGEFLQSPHSHYRGEGCSKCGRIAANNKTTHTLEQFVKLAIQIHGNKYDYSKVDYVNSKTKVEIVCLKHGSFWQTPNVHTHSTKASQCPKCSGIVLVDQQSFVAAATKLNGNRYDYTKSKFERTNLKVEIICKTHGSFWQTPNAHISQEQNCPKCNMSKGEAKIELWLSINLNLPFTHQKTFLSCRNGKHGILRFDFFIPSKNTIIEYDGEQHFRPCKIGKHNVTQEEVNAIKQRDEIKTKWAMDNGYVLLRIPYWETNKIPDILKLELL